MPNATPEGLKTTWRMEISSRSNLRPKRVDMPELRIRRVEVACPEFNWFLHQAVGSAYRWGGRDDWDRAAWTRYVERPELETWVAWVSGAPAGYFELEAQDDGSRRIQSIGLLERWFGRGLGGHLLTFAVERAFELGASRVWLTTCSHDHEHALANYRARGFELVEESVGPPNRARESRLFTSG